MLVKIIDCVLATVGLAVEIVLLAAVVLFAALLFCTPTQAQPVRLDLFPAAEPVRLELFPIAEPVRLEMFPAPAPKPQRSKAVVPAPMDGPAAVLPLVYVYGLPGCGKDRPILAEYAASHGLPFAMKSRPAPEWVTVCPTVHYPAAVPSGWKKLEGDWPGMREFVRIFEAAQVKQQPIRRAENEPLATRELIRSMPRPRSAWDHPYDLQRHIREHGFTGSLDGLTWQELELLHDGLHEGLIPTGPPAQAMPPAMREQSSRRVRQRVSRSGGKQFDPFLVISIVGLLFNIFGNCNK